MDFTGTLGTGNYALALPRATGSVGGEGLHLVGNPYPAPLDWNRVTAADRPGLDAAFYVFEKSTRPPPRWPRPGRRGPPWCSCTDIFFNPLTDTLPARAALVQLYPNPATGRFHLVRPAAATATLVNALGQVVLTRALPTGVYTLRLTLDGAVLARKLVLE